MCQGVRPWGFTRTTQACCGTSAHTSIYEPNPRKLYFVPRRGQQRRVLAIKGKTPGSKPRTFLWAFFCLLRPRGVRVPVPQRLVRTPRASRRAAANPKHYLPTCTSFFNHGIIVYDKLATRRPSGSTTEHDTQGLT